MDAKTTEAAELVSRMSKEKPEALRSVFEYVKLLVRMKDTYSAEAEAINSEFQARIEAGELTIPEGKEYLSRISEALDKAGEETT